MNAPDVDAEVAAAVEALRPELARLVRELYDEPEIGFAEHASVARIAAVLGAHGVDVEVGAFGLETAFRVSVGRARGDAAGSGSGSGSAEREASTPHFAILAEYDALPGIGHACGHNIIAGVAVGAFLGAAPLVARLSGRLSLLGTPAEENGGGKELIIRAGGFDDVDAAGMVHPGPGSGTGSVLGQRTTGVRRIAVIYHGRAAHAAGAPWLGRNALDGVVTAYQGVAQLRQHILPSDRIHGIITDGGAAPNIVPERAAALFYVRSADVDALRELTDRVVAVLEGAALATGTRAEIDVDPVPPYLPLETNVALTRRWADAFAARGHEIPPPPGVVPQGGPSGRRLSAQRRVRRAHGVPRRTRRAGRRRRGAPRDRRRVRRRPRSAGGRGGRVRRHRRPVPLRGVTRPVQRRSARRRVARITGSFCCHRVRVRAVRDRDAPARLSGSGALRAASAVNGPGSSDS